MSGGGLLPATGPCIPEEEWRAYPCVPVALAAVTGCEIPEVLAALPGGCPPPAEDIPAAAVRLAVELEDLTRWVGNYGDAASVGGVVASDRRPDQLVTQARAEWWLLAGTEHLRRGGEPDDSDREAARRMERYGHREWRNVTSPLQGLPARTRLAWGDRLPAGRYLLVFPTPWNDSEYPDPEVDTGHVVALGVEAGRPRHGFQGVWTVGQKTLVWTTEDGRHREEREPTPVESVENLEVRRPVGVKALWRVLP